ncbi:MAG TPA: MBL fold metallo-hydrolase [Phycisphaerales bacterium]|nr:MBL fold metallo-hydrolase [Phycisphaerales bacterium]
MAQKVKITTLIEDTAEGNGLVPEHGISFWIEFGEHKILFDTGQSSIITRNAQILDIDLADTEAIVISHGHYDHTGGLEPVLNIATKAKIYLHPESLDKKYTYAGGSSRTIGVTGGAKKVIAAHADKNKVVWTKEPTEIVPGLFVSGQIPRTNDFEVEEDEFFLDDQGGEPDILKDDQALYFATENGLVVLFGCAHAGVINTLDYVTKVSGVKNVDTIIGGFHLIGSGKEKVSKVIDNLERFGVQSISPGHCTGLEAALEFRKQYPRRCFMCSAGTTCEFNTI